MSAYKRIEIISNERVGADIYSLKWEDKSRILPGQFYMLGFVDGDPLLPRPISVCDVLEQGIVEVCYAVVGNGTKKLAALRAGDSLNVNGPIGNGFCIEVKYKSVALISGGIGIAPMVGLASWLKANREEIKVEVFAGFAGEPYLTERFDEERIKIATEDGSVGHKGFVTELPLWSEYDLVAACGPDGLLYAVVDKCREAGVDCLVSMDKHMACGVGACLVCACKTVAGNKRCCVDGPVFKGDELVL